MKILVCSLALSLLAATTSLHAESIYAQLCRVNPEWKKITPDAALLRDTVFTDQNALLRTHMFMVEKRLRNTTIEQSAALNKERNLLLDALHQYGVASLFPKNTHHPNERRAYFIDDYGTHCAVGNLIRVTGNDALARRIASEYNYELLRDIHTEGLSNWQKSSGITMDELALVQVLYEYDVQIPQPVNMLVKNDAEVVTPVAGQANFQNGTPWYIGENESGLLNGSWTQYYANGQPYITGSFTLGVKDGTWTVYDRDGKIKEQKTYVADVDYMTRPATN